MARYNRRANWLTGWQDVGLYGSESAAWQAARKFARQEDHPIKSVADWLALAADRITKIDDRRQAKVKTSELGLIVNQDPDTVENGQHNILAVYDAATPEEQEFWGRWYEHAHDDVQDLARQFDRPFGLVAGVVAIMSPGNTWPMNLRAARNTLELADNLLGDQDRQDIERRLAAIKTTIRQYDEEFQQLRRVLKVGTPDEQVAARVRMRELVHQVEDARKQSGEQVKRYGELARRSGVSINSYPVNIRKALAVLESGELRRYVTGPKVTAFLKALLEPKSVSRDMVLDGHAIMIYRGTKRPIAEAGQPAGAQRARMLAAYEQAAHARGITTRALQATTWFIWKAAYDDEPSLTPDQLDQAARAV